MDPRTYAPKYPLILGVYVSNQTDPISEAIIVGYPVRATTNYPSNPSLRSTMVDGILVQAKRNGFCWDESTKMVAFRPEFIFYYLDNYKKFHEYVDGIVKPHSDTGYVSSRKRNLIVFGAPGTGKSHFLEEERLKFITNDDNYERVTFHPDYTYSQFVGSYKPVTDSNGDISYKFVPGPFMRILVSAYKNSMTPTPEPYLLIIEEINRAKVAAVFGEVFQLLDRKDNRSEYEVVTSEDMKNYLADKLGGTPNDYNKIRIPDNMFIWASMNSADQGVFPMDTAFKRRWNFKYISVNDEEFERKGTTKKNNVPGEFTIGGDTLSWNVLRRAINSKLGSKKIRVHEDKMMGPFFINTNDLVDATGKIIDESAFIELIKEKVIMYLFEDAVKTKASFLFEGCNENCTRYSQICEAFDKEGIKIFGEDFKKDYYDVEKVLADNKYSSL